MKKRTRLSVLITVMTALSLFTLNACTHSMEDDETGVMYSISGNASGTQMVPSVSGNGTAKITGTYNTGTNKLTYTTTWTGLTGRPTNGAIYTSAAGQSGTTIGPAWSLGTSTGTAGTYTGELILTHAQEVQLMEGRLYYTLGTAANTGGEVRGGITATR